MFAIVEIAGTQVKVSEKQVVKVPLLNKDKGASVEFDKVLLLEKDGKTTIGTPAIKGKKVTATVVKNDREAKVIVFKKKRRTTYRRKKGHRQDYSLIQINSIA
ncbi:MAG: 50S ribosomal protein L21 [Calditrichaeota bacterium]|nr:50S ribosomal protein L21 [Calditrichota bacterium]